MKISTFLDEFADNPEPCFLVAMNGYAVGRVADDRNHVAMGHIIVETC